MTRERSTAGGAGVFSGRRVALVLVWVVGILVGLPLAGYWLWRPGLEVRDGRHDRGSNGIWLAHGWLGADEWFLRHGKTNEWSRYREPANVRALVERLRGHHITDLFPHLCPSAPEGRLPPVDDAVTSRFLDACEGLRVIPWVGGPNGSGVRLESPSWRATFARDIGALLRRHPRLAGVQLNVEPLPSGEAQFLRLLEEVRAEMPAGKLLSVAAYPPPTWWHPYPEVHWDEGYFRAVAARSDQLAVMMYDVGQGWAKTYERLMADWTGEVLAWSGGCRVLLGVPTYNDAGVGYHDPRVENLEHALRGIHRGLINAGTPPNYQGVAIYCEWEMTPDEWSHWRRAFMASSPPTGAASPAPGGPSGMGSP